MQKVALKGAREIPDPTGRLAQSAQNMRVFVSECPESPQVDGITAYVSTETRVVIMVVDYCGFAPAREVPGLRKALRGHRPGTYTEFLEVLEHHGLIQVREEDL